MQHNTSAPTVSVIIPTYNRAWRLPVAIDSVLNQSFTDFELIILDNCSSDETEKVVSAYSDPRIRYFRQHRNTNSMYVNLGTGVNQACGKYLCVLCDDDRYKPDFVQNRVKCLEGDPSLSVAFSSVEICDMAGISLKQSEIPAFPNELLSSSRLLELVLPKLWQLTASMYRRDIFLQVWDFGELYRGVGDGVCNLSLALMSEARGVYLDDYGVQITSHPEQGGKLIGDQVDREWAYVLENVLAGCPTKCQAHMIRHELSNQLVVLARKVAAREHFSIARRLLISAILVNSSNLWAWRQFLKVGLLKRI